MPAETWITKERWEAAGFSKLYALAEEVHVSEKTLRRWGQSKVKESTINFSKLAKLLKLDESLLRREYSQIKKANAEVPKIDQKRKNQLLDAIIACQGQQVPQESRP